MHTRQTSPTPPRGEHRPRLFGVADAGDLDGDGHADLVVGAWQSASAAPSGGKITLHSGKDGRILEAITCRIPGDTFGFETTNLGDVDGDGTCAESSTRRNGKSSPRENDALEVGDLLVR